MSRREGKRDSQRRYESGVVTGGQCSTCRKWAYLSKGSAKKAIKQMKGRSGRLNAYRCPAVQEGDLETWHVGHVPAVLKSGRLSRTELRPNPSRMTTSPAHTERRETEPDQPKEGETA